MLKSIERVGRICGWYGFSRLTMGRLETRLGTVLGSFGEDSKMEKKKK